jgi:probable O-glycosylation ligase (exosortase A-associated)
MRDLLLLVVLLGAMPFALARPVLAAGIYIVISVGSIHKIAFGFASDFPWAVIYSVVLLLSVIFSGKASFALGIKRYAVFLPLLIAVTLSTLMHHEQSWSLDRFIYFVKIQGALVLTLSAIRTKRDLLWILSALVASVAFHAVKGAYSVLTVFTSKGISGPPDSMIGDNNHFAIALVMTLPLLVYFARQASSLRWKIAIWTVFVACLIVTMGTWSRGGIVTLFAVGFMAALMLRSTRWRLLAVALPAAVLIWSVLPERFHERVDTIGDYREDASVLGRFQAWGTAVSLAGSEPLGGGFDHYKDAQRWSRYAPEGSIPRAAHSIYFQTLGDHGYLGLLALLLLIFAALRAKPPPCAAQSSQAGFDLSSEELRRHMLLAVAGVLIGGAFLSLAYWEGFHILLGCMLCLKDCESLVGVGSDHSLASSVDPMTLKT